MQSLRKAFNVAALVGGVALTGIAAAAFLSGFADCGADAIGACINPGAIFHTVPGILGIALVGGMGTGLFSMGYKGIGSTKPAAPPAPK